MRAADVAVDDGGRACYAELRVDERMNQTLARECVYARPYASEEVGAEPLSSFVDYRNWDRPRSACGALPRCHVYINARAINSYGYSGPLPSDSHCALQALEQNSFMRPWLSWRVAQPQLRQMAILWVPR